MNVSRLVGRALCLFGLHTWMHTFNHGQWYICWYCNKEIPYVFSDGQSLSWIANLVCRFKGHVLVPFAESDDPKHTGHLWMRCRRCGRHYLRDADGSLTPLVDGDLNGWMPCSKE